MHQEEIGEIFYFFKNHLNWKVPRIPDLIPEDYSEICSPKFGFFKESMKFACVPPKCSLSDIQTHMMKLSISIETYIVNPIDCIRVGVRDETGREVDIFHCVWNHSHRVFNGVSLVEESLLHRKASNPGGYLQFFCEIPSTYFEHAFDAAVSTGNQNVLGSLAKSNSPSSSSDPIIGRWICKMCFAKKCKNDLHYIAFESAMYKRLKNTGLVRLSQNLKDLFKQKKDTDLTIKVQGREFNVHKPVLRVRSQVFDAMLSHSLKEKNENVIEIDDCEPEVFEEILLFIYSGKTENMTSDNAFGIYYAANAYNLPDLKSECIDFLKKNTSVANICEVIGLATKHNETELLNNSVNYFAEKMDEILITCKWMMFLKENPVVANELCIKALKLGYTKKTGSAKQKGPYVSLF